MKRTGIILSALLLALIPAAFGLWGNASFSQAVPVSVPPSGQLAVPAADDHGGDTPRDRRVEPGDDRTTSPTPSAKPSISISTRPLPTPNPSSSMDDHGGDRPRDQRTEPGDDRDLRSNDSGRGSDDSGRGSDDSGSDDSRHGSDHGEDD